MNVVTISAEEQRDINVATELPLAQKALLVGMTHGYTFEVLPFRGKIDRLTPKLGWVFHEIRPQDEVPEEAQRRLKLIEEAGIPVAQVLIGHEIHTAPKEPAFDIDYRKLAMVGGSILAILVVGALGVFILMAVGAVIAASAVGLAVDPSVVVVLDDQEHTWVQLATWLD